MTRDCCHKLRTKIGKLQSIVLYAYIPISDGVMVWWWNRKLCSQLLAEKANLENLLDKLHTVEEDVEMQMYAAAAELSQSLDEDKISERCVILKIEWEQLYGNCEKLLGPDRVIGARESSP